MPKSLGGALSEGKPVVFTTKDDVPNVVCDYGLEAEALKLLEDMKLIHILRTRANDDKIEDTLAWAKILNKLLATVTNQHIPSSSMAPRTFINSLRLTADALEQLIKCQRI